ncbi:MAG: 4Fe-4S dicluster domain-containing protein [Deltaproteobacteria bacterium]|nr:4Fe-4S dicluster domain-containing protein [Deltaproteobacteria bacterium]
MFLNLLLFISMTFFVLGLIYKISTWFTRTVSILPDEATASKRFFSFVQSSVNVFFSKRFLRLTASFVLDVILQVRILRQDFLRWIMHICIYTGFIMLLLMHALGSVITASIFSDYYSTVNPYFLLRDLFGLLVIIGIVIAFFRRIILKIPRLKTSAMDLYAIILIVVILFSGILLEGAKITSRKAFVRMVEDYSDTQEDLDLTALESLWVEEFGLAPLRLQGPFDRVTLEKGEEVHEMNCAGCHSPAKYAFVGYTVASLIRPVSKTIDEEGLDVFLYYFHIIACFFGLAYLPFSKMLHIIVTPLCLLANSVMEKGVSDKMNIATRQVMELDACTHCGTCSLYCSAMMAHTAKGNDYILPSEKMVFLRRFIAGRQIDEKAFSALQEGVYLCTNCDRCTVVCPSGINLKDLWEAARERIALKGVPEPLVLSPLSLVRGLNRDEINENEYSKPLDTARKALAGRFDELSDPGISIEFPAGNNRMNVSAIKKDDTFAFCFGCQNCTTVCPVVNAFDDPQKRLGLLPHQIMCCLGLGLTELAMGPDMLWDCVTCYQCQEHCPQGVKVTDILYDLKNDAVKGFAVRSNR